MGRFYFEKEHLIDGYSAIISTHGYYSIKKGEHSGYNDVITEHLLKEKQESIEGNVDELGIVYNWERDDIEDENGNLIEDWEFLRQKLIEFIKCLNKNEKVNKNKVTDKDKKTIQNEEILEARNQFLSLLDEYFHKEKI